MAEVPPGRSVIALRPLGSAMPLGFLGLAGATFTLAGRQLDWIPVSQAHAVALVLLGFAAPLQLLAAAYAFASRDGAVGTGMGVLAGTWLATGLVTITSPPGAVSPALGLVLLVSAVGLLVPIVAARTSKLVASLVLLTASARFALTGIYELTASGVWAAAAGWCGVALAVVAVYGAFAFAVEDVGHNAVLPTMRLGSGRTIMTGDAAAQVDDVHHDAGVRRQL